MSLNSPAIVITTINGSQNEVLKQYASLCREKDQQCIIIGDKKTPVPFNLEGARFLDTEAQAGLPFLMAVQLPFNHYSRKNLGYLLAIQQGCQQIMEVDDDNIPLKNFNVERKAALSGFSPQQKGWINVYRYFTDRDIWPRGFPLRLIEDKRGPVETCEGFSPVQQFLADEDPDVDAIFRFYSSEKFEFEQGKTLLLSAGALCPFNSQSTLWFREAFPLLYLPSSCSFRMCDIWRGFVAQRIMRENKWLLSFHSPIVRQVRNAHDLHKDMEQELEGYLFNEQIMQALEGLSLRAGEEHLNENLQRCYERLVKDGYIQSWELQLLEAWIGDLQRL